ncbi:MAG TPA: glycoside hydrolase family 3 N-terminal domain-containing protein [Bryobacteraceae bacterium]|nr:glycoside hydrolase family 3 N-terminal domain-containing protein [Bryobacteraceae bacterium]
MHSFLRACCASIVCALLAFSATPRAPVKKTGVSTTSFTVRTWLRTMTLRDKAAQLIIMPIYGEPAHRRSAMSKKYDHFVRDLHVGGLIVTGHSMASGIKNAEPYAMAALLNRMQKISKLPLLVGADFERGASMRVNSTTAWPYNMAFAAAQDVDGVFAEAAETAREARALGVNWIFAPVADINNNPDNPIINIRSYGENPAQVSKFVRAYIQGAHSERLSPVLVTAKHFPGHGDSAVDSHLGLAAISADRQRLESVEFEPFRAAIAAGVDSIMTAHIAVPALESENVPATVSSKIITGVLRDELGFHGITITDAMDMQGLTANFSTAEAAVRAIEAGNDVLLMPKRAEDAINGVVGAVQSGRITKQRLDQSVAKVLTAKIQLGLLRKRIVDLDGIADQVDSPESEERAQQVSDHAVTLVNDRKDQLPLRNAESACLITLSENRHGQQGLRLIEEMKKRAPNMTATALDPGMSPADLDQVAQKSAGCGQIIVAAFVSVAAYRGNVALAGSFPDFLNGLLAGKVPVTLASLGNPYLARNFPNAAAYLTTYSPTPSSEASLAKVLFGEIPLTGRLPITIPGFAKLGDGIQLPAVHPPQKGL